MQKKTAEAAAQAREDAKADEMRKAVIEAQADIKNMQLYNDCLDRYVNSMRRSLTESETFYSKSHLDEIHENAKEKFLSKVCQSPPFKCLSKFLNSHSCWNSLSKNMTTLGETKC